MKDQKNFYKTCFFPSPMLLSPSIPTHSCPPLPRLASLHPPAWPALPPPCHSPIALRLLSSNSCRLQLCTSFLCSLLVRYRYCFSLSLPVFACHFNTGSLSLFTSPVDGCSGMLAVRLCHCMKIWAFYIFHVASHRTVSPLV